MMPSNYATISALQRAYEDRTEMPGDVVEYFLGRIERLNPDLNAFITVTAELARQQAQRANEALAAGRAIGALLGVPVAVKDFYDTAGIRTTAGFEHFANRVPRADAVMVQKLRAAGAVLLGKTNMHSLGMGTTSLNSHFGPVKNPLRSGYVAGGSSGGSAAAVAAGLCLATVDTDAVGSGRLPAAICGVTCFKPSFGVLSTEGILAGEPVDPAILMLGHGCITAGNATDTSVVFRALVDPSNNAWDADVRLGIVTNYAGTPAVRYAFEAAVPLLTPLASMQWEIQLPFEAAVFDTSQIVHDRSTVEARLFGGADLLVLPTLAAGTPNVDGAQGNEMAVSPQNTFFANYFGLPAITVPFGRDENGLPLGLQIVGKPGADHQALDFAVRFQTQSGRLIF